MDRDLSESSKRCRLGKQKVTASARNKMAGFARSLLTGRRQPEVDSSATPSPERTESRGPITSDSNTEDARLPSPQAHESGHGGSTYSGSDYSLAGFYDEDEVAEDDGVPFNEELIPSYKFHRSYKIWNEKVSMFGYYFYKLNRSFSKNKKFYLNRRRRRLCWVFTIGWVTPDMESRE